MSNQIVKPILIRKLANGNALDCKCSSCLDEKVVSKKKLPNYCSNCGARYDWSDFK